MSHERSFLSEKGVGVLDLGYVSTTFVENGKIIIQQYHHIVQPCPPVIGVGIHFFKAYSPFHTLI